MASGTHQKSPRGEKQLKTFRDTTDFGPGEGVGGGYPPPQGMEGKGKEGKEGRKGKGEDTKG